MCGRFSLRDPSRLENFFPRYRDEAEGATIRAVNEYGAPSTAHRMADVTAQYARVRNY